VFEPSRGVMVVNGSVKDHFNKSQKKGGLNSLPAAAPVEAESAAVAAQEHEGGSAARGTNDTTIARLEHLADDEREEEGEEALGEDAQDEPDRNTTGGHVRVRGGGGGGGGGSRHSLCQGWVEGMGRKRGG